MKSLPKSEWIEATREKYIALIREQDLGASSACPWPKSNWKPVGFQK